MKHQMDSKIRRAAFLQAQRPYVTAIGMSKAILVSHHFLFEHYTLAKGQENYGNALLRLQSFWKHKNFLD